MPIVKNKRISWTAAPDADIVEHRVYVVEASENIDQENTSYVSVPMPTTEIEAPNGFPAGTFSGDVNYKVGICSVDDVGNMSDLVVVESPFDFIAPGVPSDITVTNI